MTGVQPGPHPELTLHADPNSTAFLGTFWPGSEPQLVAVSGASLARGQYRPASKTLAVALYRAAPGMQVKIAIHPGELFVRGVTVSGGGLDHAGYEPMEEVYMVQSTPTEERVTVAVRFSAEEPPTPTPTTSPTPTVTGATPTGTPTPTATLTLTPGTTSTCTPAATATAQATATRTSVRRNVYLPIVVSRR